LRSECHHTPYLYVCILTFQLLHKTSEQCIRSLCWPSYRTDMHKIIRPVSELMNRSRTQKYPVYLNGCTERPRRDGWTWDSTARPTGSWPASPFPRAALTGICGPGRCSPPSSCIFLDRCLELLLLHLRLPLRLRLRLHLPSPAGPGSGPGALAAGPAGWRPALGLGLGHLGPAPSCFQ
jgi:hypothetical protein